MDYITVVIATIIGMMIFMGVIYAVFSRQCKNLYHKYVHARRYVVCHLKMPGTQFTDEWDVVPEKNHFTTVGKYQYDLNPKYAILEYRGRLHFKLDENNAIPRHLDHDNNEEILFQVQEIRTALENRAAEWIYRKNNSIALIGMAIAWFITLIALIYVIYKMQQVSPILDWLYAHPGQVIQMGSPEPTPIPVGGK